jgi:PAS domain S-box-containing protein
MIYFIDPEGYIRYANPLAAKAMHVEPVNLTGKHLTEIFRPEIARQHLDAVNRVIRSRTPFRSEVYEELPSGGNWIDVRLSPLVDITGNVIGVLGLSHDISDRKQAEEALRESETKYRLLVENSHDIIYTISPDGILTFVSPSWTTLPTFPSTRLSSKKLYPPGNASPASSTGYSRPTGRPGSTPRPSPLFSTTRDQSSPTSGMHATLRR